MAAATPTVGWIGTGRMGYQLALRLLNVGYDVAAYNRTREKCEPLTDFGAKVVDTPADLADRDFHLTSYGAAPPGETSRIIGRLWNTSQHYRREFTKLAAHRDRLGVTHLEHRLLLDCVRRGDADDAERVLVMHVRRTRLELQKHPEIFAP